MNCTVDVEKTGDGFCASIRELPGCAAMAASLPETLRLIAEAIEMHLQTLKES